MSATAAVLLLAGCAGVPTSGPVRQHEAGDPQQNSGVNVAPVPPMRGASPMLVVEGFLHAMGTDQPGFPVARQYLTDEAGRAWQPEAGTQIYADGYQPKETDSSTTDNPVVTLEAVLAGTLTPSGEYREGSGGLRHDFGLVRTDDDQWRIAKPPPGLLISRYQFSTSYVGLDLHYLDAGGTALVPDPRFFPPNAASLRTLVGSQLSGPGEWLAPAVRSDPRPAVAADAVTLSPQGVVSLTLGGSASRLDDGARRTLMAEVTTTLDQLPQVTGVQISIGATLLPLPGGTATTLTAEDFANLAPVDQQPASQLMTVREGKVRLVATLQPWTEGDPVAPALTDPGAIAAPADLAEVASVNPARTQLSVAGVRSDEASVPLKGHGLLRPDYSRQRELWAIANQDGVSGFAVFTGQDRRRIPVAVSGVPGQAVRAFRISPDGARIALVLDGDEVEQVGVARIVREADRIRVEDLRPVTVSPPAGAGRRLLDVGWESATDLLVLVSQGVTSSVVRVDQDSAAAQDIGPAEVAGLLELAAVPGRQPVLRSAGAVFRFESAFNWRPNARAVDAINYPG